MGWVNSPDYLCSASETVADVANINLHEPSSKFTLYSPTTDMYPTTPNPSASLNRLQYVDVYMDDLI